MLLGTVKSETRSDMAECPDIIKAGFEEHRDVRVKEEPALKGDAENLNLVRNLDQGPGDIDSRDVWKCLCSWVVPRIIASVLSGTAARQSSSWASGTTYLIVFGYSDTAIISILLV